MGKQFTLYSAEAHSEARQKSKMRFFQSLIIFGKSLDVCEGSEEASVQEIIKRNKPSKVNKNQDMKRT